ncbi:type II secretion system F family protein [Patescibacteria group bacterium]|nr:type II secretion system F family protein [Patescibacteria group bacterium]
MPTYSYKIHLSKGQIERGTLQAATQAEAIQKVHKLDGIALEVKELKEKSKSQFSFGGHLSLKERIVFTEQLSVMLKAGITLVQALKGLREETSNKVLAKILSEMVSDLEGGMAFSQALAKHPKVFSTIYCQMVASAERTGNIAGILNKLTEQQQKEYELKGKVRGALMYPAIVSTLLVGVIIMVITFILPKLMGLFEQSNISLPLSTQILIGISNLFIHDWYWLIGGLVGLIIGFNLMLKTKSGLYSWDLIKLKVPVLGSFVGKSYMARFTQSFASLAEAGIPVLEIFKILEGVIGSTVYAAELEKIAADVENGIKVSTAIRKSKYFPAMIGQLVSVGEQSGDLAGIFNVLGNFFEKEVDTMAKNLSTILEPLIMIVMGAAVGFVLLSVMQPILSLTNAA